MSHDPSHPRPPQNWRERFYEVIFEADTPAGKWFDVLLLVAIALSVLVVMLESVKEVRDRYETLLIGAEWVFTALFTVEYFVRIACVRRPLRYIFSFYGIVDLLAVLPTFLMVLFPGAQRLAVIRALRLLRAFRIFKLGHMLTEAAEFRQAIWASRAKIAVFLTFVAIVVVILGYSMIIVPTGIITAELTHAGRKQLTTQVCPECMSEGHDRDAVHCKYCGGKL
ncbi:MAG: ion transporter [Planctomycetes bacterium]|nr:ion transporter [Planctomycetota bacterium]